MSLSCSANGAIGLRARKPHTKEENFVLESNDIKMLLIWRENLFEKGLPNGSSKVSGKKSWETYIRICRDADIMEFGILAYLVGVLSQKL